MRTRARDDPVVKDPDDQLAAISRPDFFKTSRMLFLMTCSVVPNLSAIVLLLNPEATRARTLCSRSVNARKTSRPLSVMARA